MQCGKMASKSHNRLRDGSNYYALPGGLRAGAEAAHVFTVCRTMRTGFCVNIVIAIGARRVTYIVIHKLPTTCK